ncbi:MAG: DNA gyrase C-terminal beta-propeller domain-containing protein, partial [Pirellulaceae bacterium]
GHSLTMATRRGLIKKTALDAYSRPKRGGIIAIKLRDDDELVDVVVTKPGDEIVLSTTNGMAIRFSESDARAMGRNTSGVKGINLQEGDELVGMVVADEQATLLTVCEKGYGKRTFFGPGASAISDDAEDEVSGSSRYRTQRRGGKGLRDIKTTNRNGQVVAVVRVDETDELLMMTARGKIQRLAAAEIGVIGRNTQGVRIMSLDDGDVLAAVVRVPKEENGNNDDAETQDAPDSQASPESNSDSPAEPRTGDVEANSPNTPDDTDATTENESPGESSD